MASPETYDEWARQRRVLAAKPTTRPKDAKRLTKEAQQFETTAANIRSKIKKAAEQAANPDRRSGWFR